MTYIITINIFFRNNTFLIYDFSEDVTKEDCNNYCRYLVYYIIIDKSVFMRI